MSDCLSLAAKCATGEDAPGEFANVLHPLVEDVQCFCGGHVIDDRDDSRVESNRQPGKTKCY